MLIQLTNQKAIGLLYELQELQLIKVIQENIVPTKLKLFNKYQGILTEEQGQDLKAHVEHMRSEWDTQEVAFFTAEELEQPAIGYLASSLKDDENYETW